MKLQTKLLLLIVLISFLPAFITTTSAQEESPWLTKSLDLKLKKENQNISDKAVTGYSAYIAEEPKVVLKEWKKYVKDKYGFKLKKYDGYLKTKEPMMLGDIHSENIDVYVRVEADGKGSRLWWAGQYQTGNYIDGELFPEHQKSMEENLRSFAKEYYNEQLNEVFEKASKEQKSLNKELKKSEKEVAEQEKLAVKSAKRIAKNDSKITKAERSIRQTQQEVEELKKENKEHQEEKAKAIENEKVKEAERKKAQSTASEQNAYLQKVKKRLEKVGDL